MLLLSVFTVSTDAIAVVLTVKLASPFNYGMWDPGFYVWASALSSYDVSGRQEAYGIILPDLLGSREDGGFASSHLRCSGRSPEVYLSSVFFTPSVYSSCVFAVSVFYSLTWFSGSLVYLLMSYLSLLSSAHTWVATILFFISVLFFSWVSGAGEYVRGHLSSLFRRVFSLGAGEKWPPRDDFLFRLVGCIEFWFF